MRSAETNTEFPDLKDLGLDREEMPPGTDYLFPLSSGWRQEQAGAEAPVGGRARRVPTLGGEQDSLGVVGKAQPGGRLGVGEQLHPLDKLLSPGKPAHLEMPFCP